MKSRKIAGNNSDVIRPDEYFEEHGWFFDRGPEDGYVVTITSFDEYVLSHQCWGDMAHGFYGGIGEMKATFEKIK